MAGNSNHLNHRNERGFSLMEIVVVLGIMGIVGLGIASLLTQLAKNQKAAGVKALLAGQKIHIEQIVKDQNAWDNTINLTTDGDNGLTCMRPATFGPCTGTTIMPATGFALYEAGAGATAFLNTKVATNGFSSRGEKCAAYPSDACPIRWDFTVYLTCPAGAPTCVGPTIRVVAVPNIPAIQQENLGLSINPKTYEVDITRGVSTRMDPILVIEALSGAGAGDCPGGNIPPASGGAYGTAIRKLNTISLDPALNIVSATGTGRVTFKTGSYQCRITAPAFKVGNHFITFETAAGVPVGTPSSPAASPLRYSVPSNAVLEVSFYVAAPTAYVVKHHCQYSGYASPKFPGEPNNSLTRLGYSAGTSYATPVTYTTLSCYRTG